MYTSCFGWLKRLRTEAPHLQTVAIARGVPRWYGKGRRDQRLAPTRAMLDADLTHEEFAEAFECDILGPLDAKAIAAKLGENAVLLCWEKPGTKCHRHLVAEWFETEAGIIVPEYRLGTVATFAELPSPRDG